MATSDEELQAKADKIQKLREQIAAEEAKRLEREAAVANDITAAQLDAEATRLQAQLEAAKNANKANAVKDGAANVLEAAKADLKTAAAAASAAANASKEG